MNIRPMYVVLRAKDVAELQNNTNVAIENGYLPIGGPIVSAYTKHDSPNFPTRMVPSEWIQAVFFSAGAALQEAGEE